MTRIVRVQAHALRDIPIKPPPFRDVPNRADAMLVEIETEDGHHAWSSPGRAHPITRDFINRYLGPELVGEDPLLIERIWLKVTNSILPAKFEEKRLGALFKIAMGGIDIALWDLKGKILGLPVHEILGGAREKVPVYITGGGAYGNQPRYTIEELVAEAKYVVEMGNKAYKNTVGRTLVDGQSKPDPLDDVERMTAIREAIGMDIGLAMDGNSRMTVNQAARLCRLTEELDLLFIEEPVLHSYPRALRHLRSLTYVPVAAAENDRYSSLDLLEADAIDILQPNVNNDGGYTRAVRIAALAQVYNKTLGHGNGGGPHNVALHAGLPNGGIVEYHYHAWMLYNELYVEVPQPVDGFVTASSLPGLGLDPKPGIIDEYLDSD